MSVEYQFGEALFMCDECEEDGPSNKDFDVMRHLAKEQGWLIQKDEDTDEWTHLCPDCVKRLPQLKT